MHHLFKLNDVNYDVDIYRSKDTYYLQIENEKIPFTLQKNAAIEGAYHLLMKGKTQALSIAMKGDDVFVHINGQTHQLKYSHPLKNLLEHVGGSAEDTIKAPMPGSLVALNVKANQAVVRGEVLLVMESMKMETAIAAPRDGVVQLVHVEKGQTFDRDALLISLEPQAGEKI